MGNQNRSDLTFGEMKEFFVGVGQSIPTDLPPELIRYCNGHKKEMATKIREALLSINPYASIISEWQSFYADLGIICDLSSVRIPADPSFAEATDGKPGGFARVIIMAQGITPQSAYDLCDKNFKCWKWTTENLDKIVTSERTAQNGAYAIRIRDRVEADEELKDLSYNQLKARRVPGITLEEREIFELKYHKETGEHLDIHNWTRCDGSLCRGGDVPNVSWSRIFSEMNVSGYSLGVADGSMRARVAVV